jgi:quinol monooxygenase YgiN
MIIGRFKAQCRPESAEQMAAAIAAIQTPSRELPGVIHFDVARSLTDPNTFLALEVFEDRAALDRQNAQVEVANMLRLIDAGALVSDYEWMVWDASEPEQT